MTNKELKLIVAEIQKIQTPDFKDIAKSLPANRSTLTTFLNNEIEKPVTQKLLNKFVKAYPSFFRDTTKSNTENDFKAPHLGADRPLLYDGSLTINDLIKEKEARRIESLERAQIAEKEKDRLLGIIESNLNRIVDGQQMGRAQLKTLLELTVVEIAKNRKQNPKDVLKRVNKVVDENLSHIRGKGNPPHK